jgi:hypothetical protein
LRFRFALIATPFTVQKITKSETGDEGGEVEISKKEFEKNILTNVIGEKLKN